MRLLLGMLLLVNSLSGAANPTDDEAWIERYMARPGESAAPAKIQPGYQIGWNELRRFVGRSVRVRTEKGGTHRGVVERFDGQRLHLRSEMHGGYADMVLRADQILSTELE